MSALEGVVAMEIAAVVGTCASVDTSSPSVRVVLAVMTSCWATITTAGVSNQLSSLQDRQLGGRPWKTQGGWSCLQVSMPAFA